MALRIGLSVTRIEIDNQVRDRVVGRVWLADATQPLTLNLAGNCLRDLAGLRVVFDMTDFNPTPPDHLPAMEQTGAVGDITAARKVRELDVTIEEASELKRQGKPVPEHRANALYIEWFSERNGRVVVETTRFRVISISSPAWQMTPGEEAEQRAKNAAAILEFMHRVDWDADSDFDDEDGDEDEPMDEFAWEQFLRESDRRSEEYGALREKYKDHPDAERLVAREMGWDHLDDLLDADQRGAFDDIRDAAGSDGDCCDDDDDVNDDNDEPPAETEGIDWVRSESGYLQHPLVHRATLLSTRIIEQYREHGWIPAPSGEDSQYDGDLADFQFFVHMVGAKLAGALNGIADGFPSEPGFIVACLKRTLTYFNQAHTALDVVRQRDLMDAGFLEAVRTELFGIRAEMLDLMKQYRGKIR